MNVVKVVELVADSPMAGKTQWSKLFPCAETIDNISGIEVKNFTASVKDGKVTEYKADLHLAFRVSDPE